MGARRSAADPPGMPATALRERPIIGVTTSEVRWSTPAAAIAQGEPPQREMVLGLRYLEAIEAAGGVPMVIPPLRPEAVAALVDGLDGVCLSGGPDIHPDAYGDRPHPRLGPTEVQLDAFELDLLEAADWRRLPVLAISRGAQLVNVARGGSLHQHLPDAVGHVVAHRQTVPAGVPTHAVGVAAGTLLEEIVGDGILEVNSFHHQSVRVIGEGLRATAWAPDGTIEAFEGVDERFVLGVQWHAEGLIGLQRHAALFDAFVSAAAAHRDGHRASAGAERSGDLHSHTATRA
ncbi:MAG: Glutamine amidotransferase, class I [uncultured Solirubrobacteraceae bacterium]|uniref:Glutamine amidotransferase, class I n=1 Tax=uncultured Solirubrobacteraceae bacterium TaxID=1162706 RepID=A0A6J4S4P5_9ACTN|nr:MAG: Glutamine amidotransferase, class I [uncultured Solirubrobacteraceae bacterium]